MNLFERHATVSEPPRHAMVIPRHPTRRPTGDIRGAGLHTVRQSQGQQLDPAARRFFQSGLGADFSGVRVHSDSAAAESARRLGARAYTYNGRIFFGEGMYSPGTIGGQRLLAHELVHVIQQDRAGAPSRLVSGPEDAGERRAETVARAIGWGSLAPLYATVAPYSLFHAESRPRPRMPEFGAAEACFQRVQLTYDDGPDNAGNTRRVLMALNAAGARATFYLVGKRVVQGENWRVVFDIAAAGHWLGNHAFDWNDVKDNHIFLSGTAKDRAEKILETEWAIRDALIKGQADAQAGKTWDSIPQTNRAYIDDVIARGTGRFRTPGFKSKTINPWDKDGRTTAAAIASANKILIAVGLHPLKITEPDFWGPDYEGVTVDPKDWVAGRTRSEIESGVRTGLRSNEDSILLHSRISATAEATPAILADIKSRKYTFDPTIRGTFGSGAPEAGFANLSSVSDPPTSAELAKARSWLKKNMLSFGPYLSGAIAIGIFQLAQKAGPADVAAFAAEIKSTRVRVGGNEVPMANWMNENPEWQLFSTFFENWSTQQPFPRGTGIAQ
jgi:peptidoglycan/xylan/chitin deacetylase (PgdA/CDA1 family)